LVSFLRFIAQQRMLLLVISQNKRIATCEISQLCNTICERIYARDSKPKHFNKPPRRLAQEIEPTQRSGKEIPGVFQETPPKSPTEKIALPGSKNRNIRGSQSAGPKTPEAPREIEGAILMTTETKRAPALGEIEGAILMKAETKRAPALGVKGVDSVSTPL
jgi:hypothetical protein